MNPALFSDAEGAENQIEDIVGRGGSGHFVDRTQRSVEIEQQHLVRNAGAYGVAGGIQRTERVMDQFLMAHAGKKACLRVLRRVSGDVTQNSLAQSGNALTGQG